MSRPDIRGYLDEKRRLVEAALLRYIPTENPPLADHVRAMRYSLLAGGKRVRPILCLAAAEAAGDETFSPELVLPCACALECIHTYSLIHDDLPAMDNDELRRGQPTNPVVFGEAAAILAGDGLLTLAFELLSDPALTAVPAERSLRVIHLIARAAGPAGMVGGQVLDLAAEGRPVSFAELRAIHSRKTGALITASVEAGALLAGADPAGLAALTRYGEGIGLAFQIVDDLLNVEGSAEQLGKAAGSDAARHKATYPAFFGVEETRKKAAEAVDMALEALKPFDRKADPLRDLARYILERKR